MASSAQMNWVESEALFVGQWRDQAVPSLPGGLEWTKQGLKVFGVFWEGVKERRKRTHCCQNGNYTPPRTLVADIQRAIVNFRSGKEKECSHSN